ncbi:MAG: penicillin-insensitive murein endopeptidase [Xanthobacteraceae bacterium]
MRRFTLLAAALSSAFAAAAPAFAQSPAPSAPAKELFGRKADAAPLKARSIGFYSKGCLAGGVALPVNGQTWQVMRLSRNRNWGHPDLIAFLERFATKVPKAAGWNGILVGDLAQPRGGPMLTGHASHQVGLDADIWLTPMPNRTLERQERETFPPLLMVRSDRRDIDPKTFTPGHVQVIRTAAEDPEVERIFVNAAIKKALCRAAPGAAWQRKVRAYWGHDYHMHVRIRCPKDSPDCKPQQPVGAEDGCGKELDWWFRDAILNPPPPKEKPKPKPPLTMAELPPSCRDVLLAK